MESLGIVDLGFVGIRFTWENMQFHSNYIRERLEQFLADKEWIAKLQEARVEHLTAANLRSHPYSSDNRFDE